MTLLFAVTLLMQDPAAESAFRKICETIDKAPSLSIAFTFEQVDIGDKVVPGWSGSGKLLLKEGNKVNLGLDWKEGRQTRRIEIISDGTKVVERTRGMLLTPAETPRDLRKRFDQALCRVGISTYYPFLAGRPAAPAHTVIRATPMEDLRLGEKDGTAHTLRYRIAASLSKRINGTKVEGEKLDAQIWFDPETHRLLKRTLTYVADGKERARWTESYDAFSLGDVIPDEKFLLPSK